MNRMLVALSAVCLPMLSVAAPPITEPVDVNVTNPVVPVEVSNANPVPVTIANSSVPQRFQEEGVLAIKGNTTGASVSLLDVPAGKVAIVKFVSGQAFTTVDSWVSCDVVPLVGTSPLGGVGSHTVLTQKRIRQGAVRTDYTHEFSQEMEFYVEGGRGVGFSCGVIPAPTSDSGAFFSLSMTGILVDAE